MIQGFARGTTCDSASSTANHDTTTRLSFSPSFLSQPNLRRLSLPPQSRLTRQLRVWRAALVFYGVSCLSVPARCTGNPGADVQAVAHHVLHCFSELVNTTPSTPPDDNKLGVSAQPPTNWGSIVVTKARGAGYADEANCVLSVGLPVQLSTTG